MKIKKMNDENIKLRNVFKAEKNLMIVKSEREI
jgi:hypothetical protein